ncbi:MAG: TolC family protein [Gemmataceae bacterium]|nr:TolC family protein [Gemmataceae bacterium]
MKRSGATLLGRWWVPLAIALLGCTGTHADRAVHLPAPVGSGSVAARRLPRSAEASSLLQTSFQEAATAHLDPPAEAPAENPFSQATELAVEELVEHVLARNPSLPQMIAAWQAASARYPQVTSLDDPLFGAMVAPATLDNRDVDGYRLEAFQRFPWPGKLRLRGASALAEASAVGRDVENVRQQLIESARDAFYDYYLAFRALEVNDEALRLLRDFRQNAEARYKTGLVPQQDVLQADVEIGRQRNRGIQLERQRQVAVARLNALLHLPPYLPLPPPPKVIAVEGELPEPEALRVQALSQRLDLLALADRIAAAQASVQLAYKEYYPDFDLMATYDAFWENKDQRPSVSMRINLPVRLERRRGAVAEAEARLAELQAQLARQTDQASFEVQQAYEQWRESLRTVRLFDKEVLPAARENVKAAQAAYVTGRIPFLTLIEAQRSVVELEDQYYAATADFFRRRTALQRALTGTPTTSPLPMPPARPMPGQPGSPMGMGRQ